MLSHLVRVTPLRGARVAGLVALVAACSSSRGSGGREASVATALDETADIEFTGNVASLPPPGLRNGADRLPGAAPVATTCKEPDGGLPHVEYFGGQIVHALWPVPVFWTSNVDPNVVANIASFYTNAYAFPEYNTAGVVPVDGGTSTNQSFIDGQYYGNTFTITPTTTTCTGASPCTLTVAALRKELNAQIAAGTLPQPKKKVRGSDDGYVDSVYIFEFPANVTLAVTQNGKTTHSCTDFCGYHDWVAHGTTHEVVPLVAMPDFATGPCNTSCVTQPSNYYNDVTAVHYREIANAATDTQVTTTASGFARPSAWADPYCGEIGDICAWQEYTSTSGQTIQYIWNNLRNSCYYD